MNRIDEYFQIAPHFNQNQKTNLSFSTCALWGLDHFRTFDGTQFNFGGK